MRMGAIGMKRPEDFPKLFRIYRSGTDTSDRGRERLKNPELIAERRCTLSVAKPDEQLCYGQIGVRVSHTIFHAGPPAAKENDVLVLVNGGIETRFFRVQAVQNHGELGIFSTYYCEERGDVNGLWN